MADVLIGEKMTKPTQLSHNAAAERQYHDKRMVVADFNKAPFTIAWELTRACALPVCTAGQMQFLSVIQMN